MFVKKIHYCWIGSPVPDSVRAVVESWRRLCPDFEFYEWNDSNIDFPDHQYWNKARRERRWGMASDVIEYNTIYEHGGFYLDCDVLMNISLDKIPAPPDHLIMGYMYDCALSGGFLYAPPKHPIVKAIVESYKDINEDFWVVNNTLITDCINNNIDEFLLNGRFFQSEKHKLTIFPKEYFCQPSFFPGKPFLIDQFAGSWKNTEGKDFVTNRGKTSLLKTLRRKVSLMRTLCKNEFRDVYLNALIGRKVVHPEYWRTRYGIKGGALPASSR